jgi:hypothetical protein
MVKITATFVYSLYSLLCLDTVQCTVCVCVRACMHVWILQNMLCVNVCSVLFMGIAEFAICAYSAVCCVCIQRSLLCVDTTQYAVCICVCTCVHAHMNTTQYAVCVCVCVHAHTNSTQYAVCEYEWYAVVWTLHSFLCMRTAQCALYRYSSFLTYHIYSSLSMTCYVILVFGVKLIHYNYEFK